LADENQNFFKINKSTFERFRPLAELNKAVYEGNISDEEYEQRRSDLGF